MKNFSLFTLLAAFISMNCFANLPEKENGIGVAACANIGGEIGIKSKGCKGLSLSCVSLDFDVTLISDNLNSPPPLGTVRICFKMKLNNIMQISFKPESGETIKDFIVEKQSLIDSKLSSTLGYSSIQTIPGIYKPTLLPDGNVMVDIKVSSK